MLQESVAGMIALFWIFVGFTALVLADLWHVGRVKRAALEVLAGFDVAVLGREIHEAGGGRIPRGTIYVALAQLEREGCVESWRSDRVVDFMQYPHGRPGTRLYKITPEGRGRLM